MRQVALGVIGGNDLRLSHQDGLEFSNWHHLVCEVKAVI